MRNIGSRQEVHRNFDGNFGKEKSVVEAVKVGDHQTF